MMKIKELTKKSVELLENTSEGCLMLNSSNEFMLLKHKNPSNLNATFYEPILCLILQGEKELIVGSRKLTFGIGESLIVSHELPVVSRITKASENLPYIALILRLDLSIIRGLYDDFGESALEMNTARSFEVDYASPNLVDSLYRLLITSQDSIDSKVLFPQILREVHYRLLQAPYGAMLRGLLRHDSHASKISKAISIIRSKYKDTLSVPSIAKSVGMSTSSFHHHFKAITESTPLQYQKDLRLLEAQRLLISEGESVTSAALLVGYQSPNQFSREYTRKFGYPPSSESKNFPN